MRPIPYSRDFDSAVEAVGGYEIVDQALDPIIDGLSLNPYGFHLVENDYVRFRYAITRNFMRNGRLYPPLVIIFSIDEDGSAVLEHVEEHDPY